MNTKLGVVRSYPTLRLKPVQKNLLDITLAHQGVRRTRKRTQHTPSKLLSDNEDSNGGDFEEVAPPSSKKQKTWIYQTLKGTRCKVPVQRSTMLSHIGKKLIVASTMVCEAGGKAMRADLAFPGKFPQIVEDNPDEFFSGFDAFDHDTFDNEHYQPPCTINSNNRFATDFKRPEEKYLYASAQGIVMNGPDGCTRAEMAVLVQQGQIISNTSVIKMGSANWKLANALFPDLFPKQTNWTMPPPPKQPAGDISTSTATVAAAKPNIESVAPCTVQPVVNQQQCNGNVPAVHAHVSHAGAQIPHVTNSNNIVNSQMPPPPTHENGGVNVRSFMALQMMHASNYATLATMYR